MCENHGQVEVTETHDVDVQSLTGKDRQNIRDIQKALGQDDSSPNGNPRLPSYSDGQARQAEQRRTHMRVVKTLTGTPEEIRAEKDRIKFQKAVEKALRSYKKISRELGIKMKNFCTDEAFLANPKVRDNMGKILMRAAIAKGIPYEIFGPALALPDKSELEID